MTILDMMRCRKVNLGARVFPRELIKVTVSEHQLCWCPVTKRFMKVKTQTWITQGAHFSHKPLLWGITVWIKSKWRGNELWERRERLIKQLKTNTLWFGGFYSLCTCSASLHEQMLAVDCGHHTKPFLSQTSVLCLSTLDRKSLSFQWSTSLHY